jgi:hypothetical protein
MTPAEQRTVEDRLLVVETKLDALATKAELVAVKLELSKELADVKFDILRWYVGLTLVNGSVILILIVGATLVNHFWK